MQYAQPTALFGPARTATRLAVFPSAPSDDSNRYLWEGRLITEGISPYATTADDDRLAPCGMSTGKG